MTLAQPCARARTHTLSYYLHITVRLVGMSSALSSQHLGPVMVLFLIYAALHHASMQCAKLSYVTQLLARVQADPCYPISAVHVPAVTRKAYMYVCADVINEPQHLCMPITQHSRRWQAGQLSPQRHQLLLRCCHEGGAGCRCHLDKLLAHCLAQPQSACRHRDARQTQPNTPNSCKTAQRLTPVPPLF